MKGVKNTTTEITNVADRTIVFQLVLPEPKVRKRLAPATKKIPDKTKYNRKREKNKARSS